jgi:hypothetical protein
MSKEIYQLKITTKDIKPAIWRTVLIPANSTFLDLHEIIMQLFGFEDSHLFAFMPSNNYEDQLSDGTEGTQNAQKVKLFKYFAHIQKLNYTYDFGDNWEFKIELQKILPRDISSTYPQCIKHKGGMMLEDCGGVYGYEVISNWCRNKTEENAKELIDFYGDEEALEWYEDFNPDEFDINSFSFSKNL